MLTAASRRLDTMPDNKNHWYDGLFYDLFIAPNQDEAFAQVKELLYEGATILDIGCGTGRLASQLLDKCGKIVIIDPSERNIRIARRKFAGLPSEKLMVGRMDAFEFLATNDFHFDFITMSYVVHEIHEDDREILLRAASAVADRIILVEYLAPQPRNFCGVLNQLVEYAAGPGHYRNFKSFMRKGGITGLLKELHLKMLNELKTRPCSSHIAVVEGKKGRDKSGNVLPSRWETGTRSSIVK